MRSFSFGGLRRGPGGGRGGRSGRLASHRVAAVAAGLVALTMVPAAATQAAASQPGTRPSIPTRAAGTGELAGGVPAPGASQVSQGCNLGQVGSELGPAPASPSSSPLSLFVRPPGGVADFTATSSGVYAVNANGVYIYSLSGQLQHHFGFPANLVTNESNGSNVGTGDMGQIVVDPSGDVYLSAFYAGVVEEFSPAGSVVWTLKGGNPPNIFGATDAHGNWVLGVSSNNGPTSALYRPGGTPDGQAQLVLPYNGFSSEEPNGDLLVSTGAGHVQTWNPQGTVMLSEFGSQSTENTQTGGPLEFFYQGGAVLGSDGRVYAVDGPSDITVTGANGILAGITDLNGGLAYNVDGNVAEVGGNLYLLTGPLFNGGADAISVVPQSAVAASLAVPQKSVGDLGWGAGLATPVTGNYFPPGATVSVAATFDPWWAGSAGHLELSYGIWNDANDATSAPPTMVTVPLPTTAPALASIPLPVPAADTAPGPYQVEAQLYDTSASPPSLVASACMPYTVGAAGDRLDLASLPAGIGGGGAADPRGVALNHQLGLNGLRSSEPVNWSQYLPDCNAAAPTAATCGPSAMTFAGAPQGYFHAAWLAQQDQVTYWVQVSGGDATSQALVQNGWWQGDIRALVAYYTQPPAGCNQCAPVTAWEPWNEANNTGWSNASGYVDEVLKPFYNAVKAADATATVIGGSSLGVPLPWWQQLIAAGGLSYLDVAGVHPYPGNNDSWEEDGIVGQLRSLKGLLGNTPLWITEVGWWSDGDYNFTQQASDVARAMIWQKVLGIPVWNYFYNEGSWGNDGVSFSLIQVAGQGDDYVKPAALATMATSNLLAGRSSLGLVDTGIPQAYEATFSAAGGTSLAAVWTDGLATPASLSVTAPGGGSVPVTITTQYGAASSETLQSAAAYDLPLSDEVTWVSYPAGDQLTVGPTASYGTDLALASQGATATASSGNAGAALVNPAAATSWGQGWTPVVGDTAPNLTVRLAQTATIDRVLVDTQSVGSVAGGLRDYTVSVESPGGSWAAVATVTGQFRNHVQEVDFAPVAAQAVRIAVSEVNYGGYCGGGIPYFWSIGPAMPLVHAVEVYAGTASPATLQGGALAGLPGISAGGAGGDPTSAGSGSPSVAPPPTSGPPVPATHHPRHHRRSQPARRHPRRKHHHRRHRRRRAHRGRRHPRRGARRKAAFAPAGWRNLPDVW